VTDGARELRDVFPVTMLQKCMVAAQLDRCDHRGRLVAFYRGEPWAVQELSDMAMVEFFWNLFQRSELAGGE